MVDVLTIGETMILVAPSEGERLELRSSFRLAPGGAESNVAIQCSRLGLRTAWMSNVGHDSLGTLIVDGIARYGVDVSLVDQSSNAPTGVYFKNPMTDRTEVIYYRRGSAASTMSVKTLEAVRHLRPRIVMVSGITPSLSRSCAEMVSRIVSGRYFGEALVAFDINFRHRLWESHADAANQLHRIASDADIVFVGRDEAEDLWGTRTARQVRNFLPTVKHLVVKDGDVEAVEFERNISTRVPALPVEVVESVGAGDAFAAGWLSAYANGGQAELRLLAGHTSAAAVLRSATDQAADIAEVRRLVSMERN